MVTAQHVSLGSSTPTNLLRLGGTYVRVVEHNGQVYLFEIGECLNLCEAECLVGLDESDEIFHFVAALPRLRKLYAHYLS